jgi:hypothetical protein
LTHELEADTPLKVVREGLAELDRLLHYAVLLVKRRVEAGDATDAESLLARDYEELMWLLRAERVAVDAGLENVRIAILNED